MAIVVLSALVHAQAAPFQFGTVAFEPELQRFAELNGRHWAPAGGPGFLAQFDACQRQQERDGLLSGPYLSGCFFRSASDANLEGMWVYARDQRVQRVVLVFGERGRHSTILKQLTDSLGVVDARGRYTEEAVVHQLVAWRRSGYDLVYDHGGVTVDRPLYLVYETRPTSPAGFNPPVVDLSSLRPPK